MVDQREGGQSYFGVRPGHMRLNSLRIGGWINYQVIADADDVPLAEGQRLDTRSVSWTVELAPRSRATSPTP